MKQNIRILHLSATEKGYMGKSMFLSPGRSIAEEPLIPIHVVNMDDPESSFKNVKATQKR